MQLPLLLTLVSGIILLAAGISWRAGHFGRLRWQDAAQIVLVSFGLATAFGMSLAPAIWLAFSISFRSGTVEDNMMPGSSLSPVLLGTVVGVSMTVLWGIWGYLKAVNPRRRRRPPPD
jgi:hypothetical protein